VHDGRYPIGLPVERHFAAYCGMLRQKRRWHKAPKKGMSSHATNFGLYMTLSPSSSSLSSSAHFPKTEVIKGDQTWL